MLSRMVTRERRIDRGRARLNRHLATVGGELREARLAAGVSQRVVASACGISHTEVSRIERAAARRVPLETLVLLAATVGLDLSVRMYPDGEPVRDAAQLALLAKLRRRLPRTLLWRSEVPLRVERDRRAWDASIEGGKWSVPVDAETRLRDIQALTRRVALKARDDDQEVVILLVADTRHNRRVLRLAAADLAGMFPVPGRDVLAALVEGRKPRGSGVIML
jgi:transcriptional regulator with XRE-family HTH domain